MVPRLARLVAREVARPLGARLGPVNLALLFVLVQFATVIPWAALRAFVIADPNTASQAGVGVLALWQFAWGRVLRRALVDRPALAPIWRTAPSAWARGLTLAPVLVVVAFPALVPALLWPAAAVLPGRVGLAVVFGALALSWSSAPLLVLAAAAAAVAEPTLPTWPMLLVAPWIAGKAHAHCLRPRRLPRPPRTGSLRRPRGPLHALVWLDATALLRGAPDLAPSWLLAALPAAGLLAGIRRHDPSPATLQLSSAVLACISAPLGGAALARLRTLLGDAFFVRRWPPPPPLRVAALWIVALGTFAPSGVAMAAALSSADSPHLVAPLWPMWLAAGACAAGAVPLATRAPFAHGLHLAWVAGVLGLVLWDCPEARSVEVVALTAGLGLAWRRLGRRTPVGPGVGIGGGS